MCAFFFFNMFTLVFSSCFVLKQYVAVQLPIFYEPCSHILPCSVPYLGFSASFRPSFLRFQTCLFFSFSAYILTTTFLLLLPLDLHIFVHCCLFLFFFSFLLITNITVFFALSAFASTSPSPMPPLLIFHSFT